MFCEFTGLFTYLTDNNTISKSDTGTELQGTYSLNWSHFLGPTMNFSRHDIWAYRQIPGSLQKLPGLKDFPAKYLSWEQSGTLRDPPGRVAEMLQLWQYVGAHFSRLVLIFEQSAQKNCATVSVPLCHFSWQHWLPSLHCAHITL